MLYNTPSTRSCDAKRALFDIDLGWMESTVEARDVARVIVDYSCSNMDNGNFDAAVTYLSEAIAYVWNEYPPGSQTLGNVIELVAPPSTDAYAEPMRVWLAHRITVNPIDKAELYVKTIYNALATMILAIVEHQSAGNSTSTPDATPAPDNNEIAKTTEKQAAKQKDKASKEA